MNKLISYASNNEDIILWHTLSTISKGVYIDVGAQHPVADSVTKIFYEHGWNGLNIEPVRLYHALLEADRPRDINIQAAAMATSGTIEFHEISESGLSTTNGKIALQHEKLGYTVNRYCVPSVTLSEICCLHKITEVHFLKIDAEGAEQEVLQGANLNELRPWIIVVEATEPNTQIPSHERWEYLLTDAGYNFVFFDGVNRFYLSPDHPELRRKLSIPANVFDEFIPYRYWLLQQAHEEYKREFSAMQSNIRAITSTLSWQLTKPFRAPFIIWRKFIKKYNSANTN